MNFLLFFTIYLCSHVLRFLYEKLKQSGKVDSKSMLVFSLILIVMVLMWASWFSMLPLDPLAVSVPGLLRWIGLGIVVLGFILALGGVIQLRGVENIERLVMTGIFSRLRHPMYTGFILWILGGSLYYGAPAALAAGSVGIANILFWRRREEKEAEDCYGETYRQYRRSSWF